MTNSNINEKQLVKVYQQKQKELDELKVKLEKAEYKKHLDTFASTIVRGEELIKLIKKHKLNVDDVRLFASLVNEKLEPIYKNFDQAIRSNQTKRARKNEARKQRRAAKEVAAMPSIEQALNDATAATPADTNCVYAPNMSPVPAEGADRTY